MTHDEQITQLARQIDAVRQSERFLVNPEEVAGLRRQAACKLHQICAEFVLSLNSKLAHATLEISPPSYMPETFNKSGVNLIQVSSQGREMQITFQATPQLYSTEKFPIPYVLEGEVRTYNQKMLERFEVRSHLLFFCLDKDGAVWRFFDWRGPRTAPVDSDLLVNLMERLF
jgi:hypothetical protein